MLDESLALIGEVVNAVGERMTVESAAAYITEEPLDVSTRELVRDAVRQRMPQFNNMTYYTVQGLLQAPTVKSSSLLHQVLVLTKEQMLQQTTAHLSPEMQTLEELAAVPRAEDRRIRLRVRVCTLRSRAWRADACASCVRRSWALHTNFARSSLYCTLSALTASHTHMHTTALRQLQPACAVVDELVAACMQAMSDGELVDICCAAASLSEDMEEGLAIRSVPLLCRLVLIHEEAAEQVERIAPSRKFDARPQRTNVCKASATVLRELIQVGQRDKRLAYLTKCAPPLLWRPRRVRRGCAVWIALCACLARCGGSEAGLQCITQDVWLSVCIASAVVPLPGSCDSLGAYGRVQFRVVSRSRAVPRREAG